VSQADAQQVAALDAALSRDLGTIAVSASPEERARLLRYAALLAHWNSSIRLTGPTSLEAIVREQLVDSMGFALALDAMPDEAFWDVGAGGGLPGIALAIRYPERRFVLVEPTHKKTAFLRHANQQLGLDNVTVVNGRVERDGRCSPPHELAPAARPTAALSRATLPPELWFHTARALVGPGGAVIVSAAGELPVELVQDPRSTSLGQWRYRVPATDAPRVLVARRFLGDSGDPVAHGA
jgi:16S rRNA (guanine(527)-N(7))-methyltransferase RsmG